MNITCNVEFVEKFIHDQKDDNENFTDNFVLKFKAKNKNNFYCFCCGEVLTEKYSKHLVTENHSNNYTYLYQSLLKINLYQLAKHKYKEIENFLETSLLECVEASKNKLEDFKEFENFLLNSLKVKYNLDLYGSVKKKLCLKQSDINVNLDFPNIPGKRSDILNYIRYFLRKEFKYGNKNYYLNENFDSINELQIKTAKNNIISLTCNNEVLEENLIDSYLDFDRRVKLLVVGLSSVFPKRKFRKLKKLNYKKNLILTIMVIYYLQNCHEPILPLFHKNSLIRFRGKQIRVNPISKSVINQLKNTWVTKNKQSIGELWINFFKFYLFEFSYNNYINIIHECVPFENKKFCVCDFIDGTFLISSGLDSIFFNDFYDGLYFVYKYSCFPYFGLSQKSPILKLSYEKTKLDDKLALKLTEKASLKNFSKIINLKKKKNKFKPIYLQKIWYLRKKLDFQVLLYNEGCDLLQQEFAPRKDIWPDNEIILEKTENSPEIEKVDIFIKEKSSEILKNYAENYFRINSIQNKDNILKCVEYVKYSLRETIKSFFSEYESFNLFAFGSIANGFGEIKSDLDLVLVTESSLFDRENLTKTMRQLSKILRRNKSVCEIILITRARIPIIKLNFKTSFLRIDCDLSFNNHIVIHNTRLLKTYNKLDERLAIIGVFIKKYMKKFSFIIRSYAMNLMVIYYLQKCDPPVLPNLQELEDFSMKPKYLGEYLINFTEDIGKIKKLFPLYTNKMSTGELILGFFEFYTEKFNFLEHVISIRKSSILTKEEKGWYSEIAIEDPFVLTHNLASPINYPEAKTLEYSFILARNYFSTINTIYEKDVAFKNKKPQDILFNLQKIIYSKKNNHITEKLKSLDLN